MTDEEWQHLYENYETTHLLDAVKHVDALRRQLGDIDGYRPPEIRDDLLRLHQMSMDVVNRGWMSQLHKMALLALEIEDEIVNVLESVVAIHITVSKLTELLPDSAFDYEHELGNEEYTLLDER